MWKRINWRAGALFALAFVLLFTGRMSRLAVIGLIALGGLMSVVDFLIVYHRRPPSLERFCQLNLDAGAAWASFAGAAVLYLDKAPLGLARGTLDLVTT